MAVSSERQIDTKINIKPNCKDIIFEFSEPSIPDGFNLKMLLPPDVAQSIAHQLLDSVRRLQEEAR
jgi:hypothetical protein